jgi:hypothetical protein
MFQLRRVDWRKEILIGSDPICKGDEPGEPMQLVWSWLFGVVWKGSEKADQFLCEFESKGLSPLLFPFVVERVRDRTAFSIVSTVMAAETNGPMRGVSTLNQLPEERVAHPGMISFETGKRDLLVVGPEGALFLESERDLSNVVECGERGESVREKLSRAGRKRLRKRMGNGTHRNTVIPHSERRPSRLPIGFGPAVFETRDLAAH